MTLPEKDPKGYLALARQRCGLMVAGEARHLAELEALFCQRGICCKRHVGLSGRDVLLLDPGADLLIAQQVLDSYKAAKGS